MKKNKFKVMETPIREILSSKFSESVVEEMLNLVDVHGFDAESSPINDLLDSPMTNDLDVHETIEMIQEYEGLEGVLNYAIGNDDSEIGRQFVETIMEVCKSDSKGTEKSIKIMMGQYMKECVYDYI